MKLLSLSFILIFAFGANAQDLDHLCEPFFKGRSLKDFEQSVGMTSGHYLNGALCTEVNTAYQHFFDSIHERLESGHQVNEDLLDQSYSALILETKPLLKGIKPPPRPTPMPTTKSLDCNILGFEGGDFSGWLLSRGEAIGGTPFSFFNEFIVGPGSFHMIQSGGVDPLTGISKVNPTGGAYSVLLGDETGVGSQGARLKRTFTVDPTNVFFEYSYAVIFEAPLGHSPAALPYFTVRIYDMMGDTISCGNYAVLADATTATGYNEFNSQGHSGLYQDWTTIITNLSAYMGQPVTVEFTAGDCSAGAHFCYAYVDASCGAGEITSPTDTLCTGETTVLTAPPGAASYLWSTGEVTQSILVDSGGTYSCHMIPFQAGACSFSMSKEIFEVIGPIVSFISSDDTICGNEFITFTDQSTIASPATITGYTWDFGNGTVTSQGLGTINGTANTSGDYTLPTHYFTTGGVYTVELSVESNTGCDISSTGTVVIEALPQIDTGPDLFLCDTNEITLTATGALSHTWDQGILNGIPFVQNAGVSNTYTVIGVGANGCIDTSHVLVETYDVPIVDVGPDQTICFGNSVTLAASGAASYVWDNGILDNEEFIPAVGTVNYTVIGTSSDGCQDTNDVTVIVNPLPVVNAGADQTVCEGTSVVLNGSGSATPTWANGFSTGTPFIPPVGNNTYTLSDTLATGCFAVDSTVVVVLPNPIVTALDTAVCFGESVTLSGQGAVNYSWTEGITNGVTFTPGQTTSYTVTGTDANGCQNSATVVVTVYPNPNASFTLVDSIMTAESAFTTFNNYSTGATTYEWDFGDGSDINTAFEPTHYFPNESSIYYEITLVAISHQGCIDSTSQTGLVYAEQTIYAPNAFTPDDDEFNQVFLPILNGFDESNYVLFIYNRWGEVIFESYDVNVGWDGTYGNQGIAVQDGTYTWKIQVGVKESSEVKEFLGHVTVLK